MPLQPGDTAPDFIGESHNGRQIKLADYRGKNVVVLYFYPRDHTSMCTKQACGFRDAYEEFVKAGAVVIGVSADSLKRHRAFSASQNLPFLLLSDRDGSLRRAYGVRKIFGVLPRRVTYVIGKQGIIRHVSSALFSVDGHVTEALKVVHELVREN